MQASPLAFWRAGTVGTLFDSWSAEEETDWGMHGQPLTRKYLSSLPVHLQQAPLQGPTRNGSALPAQPSSLQLMPGGHSAPVSSLEAWRKRDRPASRTASMLLPGNEVHRILAASPKGLCKDSADAWGRGDGREGAALMPRVPSWAALGPCRVAH